jgi:hypothetical protein
MGHTDEEVGVYSLDAEADSTLNGSRDRLVVKPIKTWKGYVWDTWELPKDQRWLLFKLDAFVLTFASVSCQILPIRNDYKHPNSKLSRLVTSSRILIYITSTMLFLVVWRRICQCTVTSS